MNYTLNSIPLFDELKNSQNILLAGAGGGFDIFSGVPLFLALQAQGKNVHLANLSFSPLGETRATKICRACWRVDSSAPTASNEPVYFPEKELSLWYKKTFGENLDVYAFNRTGALYLTQAYTHLIDLLDIDTVVLVDGGTDSLMLGLEPSLGSPMEDSASIAAVYAQPNVAKYLTCLGFGIDHFHGISHYHFLENVAELSKEGGFLGVLSLMPQMEEVQHFLDLIAFSNAQTARPSIVANSIGSALQGYFGDYHATERTKKSELFINPLMYQYWNFKLEVLAPKIRHLDYIKNTKTFLGLMKGINEFIESIERKPKKDIPL